MKTIFAVACIALLCSSAFAGTVLLTFSEFPVNTIITNQYAPQGVVFSGLSDGPPIIANDGAMPDSPVLSPNPPFAGDFQFTFVSGATQVEFDSGFWNSLGTGVINVFDVNNNSLGSFTNTCAGATCTVPGVDHFDFTGLGLIGRITFDSLNDPFGADIDNLTYTPAPEPGTLALLASGFLGLAGAARRFLR
jgi:hypothetical protein